MKFSKPTKNHGVVETRLVEALAWWKLGFPGISEKTFELCNMTGTLKRNEESSWTGGSNSDIVTACMGRVDMSDYHKALNELAPRLRRFASEFSSEIMRRKRTFSEHDGEFIHERRTSETPFQYCYRKPVPLKIIKMDVNMFVSASVDKEDIQRYGACVWATTQALERMGRKVEITWISQSSSNDRKITVRIPLKKATEYLAPSILAATMTANFERRMGFGLGCLAMDENEIDALYCMGQPDFAQSPMCYEGGTITFSPAQLRTLGPELVAQEMQKALTT